VFVGANKTKQKKLVPKYQRQEEVKEKVSRTSEGVKNRIRQTRMKGGGREISVKAQVKDPLREGGVPPNRFSNKIREKKGWKEKKKVHLGRATEPIMK